MRDAEGNGLRSTQRREFVVTGLAAVITILGPRRSLAEAARLELVWTVAEERVPQARDALELNPEQIQPDPTGIRDTKGQPLFYILIAVVLITELAGALEKVYKGWTSGGVIIDASGPKLEVRTDPKLPGGMVVVRQKDGKVETHSNASNFDTAKWAEILLSAVRTKK